MHICSTKGEWQNLPPTSMISILSHHYNLQVLKKNHMPEPLRTGHGTRDWFQIGKGVRQGCMLLPCLLNLYAEYIIRNAGLEETQTGIKIAGRNINTLRYADDTTLMAESEEELKSLLMKVKVESEKVGLKLRKRRSWHLVPPLHGK